MKVIMYCIPPEAYGDVEKMTSIYQTLACVSKGNLLVSRDFEIIVPTSENGRLFSSDTKLQFHNNAYDNIARKCVANHAYRLGVIEAIESHIANSESEYPDDFYFIMPAVNIRNMGEKHTASDISEFVKCQNSSTSLARIQLEYRERATYDELMFDIGLKGQCTPCESKVIVVPFYIRTKTSISLGTRVIMREGCGKINEYRQCFGVHGWTSAEGVVIEKDTPLYLTLETERMLYQDALFKGVILERQDDH